MGGKLGCKWADLADSGVCSFLVSHIIEPSRRLCVLRTVSSREGASGFSSLAIIGRTGTRTPSLGESFFFRRSSKQEEQDGCQDACPGYAPEAFLDTRVVLALLG